MKDAACAELPRAGLNGKEAIARSREVVQPLRRAMALPFLGLIVLAKIMGPLRLAVLARLPQRYYWDLPEIPLVAYVGITLFGVTMQRCALHFVSITPVTGWKTLFVAAGDMSELCKGNVVL